MSDKNKKLTPEGADLNKEKADKAAAVNEKEAAKKVAKAAKGPKAKKENRVKNAGSAVKRFFKDFKGEAKKVVWPDAKTVLKSTAVVLVVVLVCGLAIYGIDTALTAGIKGLKGLATDEVVSTTLEDAADHDHDHDDADKKDEDKKEDETTTKKADEDKKDKEEATTEEATEEETTKEDAE